jgi:osmotically-inducible protein OsmY
MIDHSRYLVGRIRQALAEDERTNILDLQVRVTSGRVFLIGTVDSVQRRLAVEQVVGEVVPAGMRIVNDLWTATYSKPTGADSVT